MRYLALLSLVLVVGCGKAEEKTIEAASGGQVTVDGDKMVVETEEGKATIVTSEEGMTITTEDGKHLVARSSGDEGTMKIETDEGTMTFGQTSVPKGFPLPVLDDATIVTASHMAPAGKGETFHVQMTSKIDPAKAADIYEKALKDKNLSPERTKISIGPQTQIVINGESDTVQASVVVTSNSETPCMVIATWSAKQ